MTSVVLSIWLLSVIPSEWHQITLALIASVPATIAAVAGLIAAIKSTKAEKHAREANDAVNHRHERGGAKVYDLITYVYRLCVDNKRAIDRVTEALEEQYNRDIRRGIKKSAHQVAMDSSRDNLDDEEGL